MRTPNTWSVWDTPEVIEWYVLENEYYTQKLLKEIKDDEKLDRQDPVYDKICIKLGW